MHTVAAVIDEGMLTFDFAIPCEVFGLDRSDIVDPWYEFLVVAARARRVRTQTGEIPKGTVEQRVVPASEVKGRNLELSVPLLDIERLPIRVVGRVVQHLEITRRELPDLHGIDCLQRHVPEPFVREFAPLGLIQSDGAVAVRGRVALTAANVHRLAEIP